MSPAVTPVSSTVSGRGSARKTRINQRPPSRIPRDSSRRCPGQHLGFRPVASSKTQVERSDPPKDCPRNYFCAFVISWRPTCTTRSRKVFTTAGVYLLQNAGFPVDIRSGSRSAALHSPLPTDRSCVYPELIATRSGGFYALCADFSKGFAGSWQHPVLGLVASCIS